MEDTCRICFGDASDGRLFSPCKCKGTMRYVHAECLQRWRKDSANKKAYFRCEQCLYEYNLRRITASGLLGRRCVVPGIFILLLLALWALGGLLCHLVTPRGVLSKLLGLPSPYAQLLAGMLLFGFTGFFIMIATNGCPDCSELDALGCPDGCGRCLSDSCLDCCRECGRGQNSPEGCLLCLAIGLVLFIIVVGLLRTGCFIYRSLQMFATGARDALDSIVLEVHTNDATRGAGPAVDAYKSTA